MEINEEKTVTINTEEAYGEYNDALMQRIPLDDVKAHLEPIVGMTIGVQMEDGNQIPAEITEITESEVVLDMNHPLAGKTLQFEFKVIEINDEAKYMDQCSTCSDTSCCDDGCSG